MSKNQTFYYWGKDINGNKIQGKFIGNNKNEVYKELTYNGVYINRLTRDYTLFRTYKIKGDLLLNFIEEWYSLELTNLNTQDCLSVIKSNTTNKRFKSVLVDILYNAETGLSLSFCFKKHEDYFPEIFLMQILNGLENGNIVNTLLALKNYYKDRMSYSQKIKNSMIYPKLLAIVLFLVFFVICKFIVPSFYSLFSDSNQLSKFNRSVLNGLMYVGDKFFLILLIFILLLTFIKILMKIEIVKSKLDLIKVKLFKKYYRLYVTTMTANTLYLYWECGTNKIRSLELLLNVFTNKFFKKRMLLTIELVKNGMTLGDSLEKSKLFDSTFNEMIIIGEKNNCIIDNLKNAGFYYQSKLNLYIEKLVKLIEPLLILFMSLIVLFMVLVVFIPMLNGFKVVI